MFSPHSLFPHSSDEAVRCLSSRVVGSAPNVSPPMPLGKSTSFGFADVFLPPARRVRDGEGLSFDWWLAKLNLNVNIDNGTKNN